MLALQRAMVVRWCLLVVCVMAVLSGCLDGAPAADATDPVDGSSYTFDVHQCNMVSPSDDIYLFGCPRLVHAGSLSDGHLLLDGYPSNATGFSVQLTLPFAKGDASVELQADDRTFGVSTTGPFVRETLILKEESRSANLTHPGYDHVFHGSACEVESFSLNVAASVPYDDAQILIWAHDPLVELDTYRDGLPSGYDVCNGAWTGGPFEP